MHIYKKTRDVGWIIPYVTFALGTVLTIGGGIYCSVTGREKPVQNRGESSRVIEEEDLRELCILGTMFLGSIFMGSSAAAIVARSISDLEGKVKS
jgi:hypothetical protein